MADHANYEQTSFQLAERDTLTFLSDGVIEARNPQGELFGFDRARDLSTKPARAIATTPPPSARKMTSPY